MATGRTIRLPRFETAAEARLQTWVQFIRSFYRMERRIEQALAAYDVTLPQFDVLATLWFAKGITQQELAERLLVTKGNVCGLLDRMEKAGWVQRQPDPNDRRANRLYLAPAGLKKLESLHRDHHIAVLQLMRPLSDGDVKSFRGLLEELDKGIQT